MVIGHRRGKTSSDRLYHTVHVCIRPTSIVNWLLGQYCVDSSNCTDRCNLPRIFVTWLFIVANKTSTSLCIVYLRYRSDSTWA